MSSRHMMSKPRSEWPAAESCYRDSLQVRIGSTFAEPAPVRTPPKPRGTLASLGRFVVSAFHKQ